MFYQLIKGASDQERVDLHLLPVTEFHYLNHSGCVSIPNVDDHVEFKEMKAAMLYVGFAPVELAAVLRILAGILHLGNLVLIDASTATAPASAIAPESQQTLGYAAGLFQVDRAELQQALLSRKTTFGNDTVFVQNNLHVSKDARDSLAKAVYGELFNWLVRRIDQNLCVQRTTQTIGILDIFGFEIFKNNSFEQLCINYANEKLQVRVAFVSRACRRLGW